MPAELQFDHQNCKQYLEFRKEWTDRAVNIFYESIQSAPEIYFTQSSEMSHSEIQIGDLLVYEKSILKYGLISKLLTEEVAIVVPKELFFEHYERLFTKNIERWNNNRRTGGVLNC